MTTLNANLADEIMCPCSGTRRSNIQNMFESGMDIDAISRATGALSGCRGCEWDIAHFLDELVKQKNIVCKRGYKADV
ncbi:MAG: (2Fe-2S)-binding protein [Methylotenera sp.]|nr:(2Fe-2S)-binding protein [Methylotenera sp.]